MAGSVRIYTRAGDRGRTTLIGGRRVEKSSLRLEAYGAVDELNATLGLVRAFATERAEASVLPIARLVSELLAIQDLLFVLGAELATPSGSATEGRATIAPEHVQQLERLIDSLEGELSRLTGFVLPGGGVVSAALNQARTVCRRAERDIIRLAESDTVGESVVPLVNRLGDALFVLSRFGAKCFGEEELNWR